MRKSTAVKIAVLGGNVYHVISDRIFEVLLDLHMTRLGQQSCSTAQQNRDSYAQAT